MFHNKFDESDENGEARKSQKQSEISSGGRQKASDVVDKCFDSFLDDQRTENS